MKRFLQTILATAVLAGTVGAVHAQNWVGLRTGYPLGVTLHYGVQNAISNSIDLRVSGRVEAIGGSPRFGVGVDFLRTVSVEPPFFVYVGGGPAISVGGDAAYFEVHGLLGGEYRFTDLELAPLGIFGELSLGAELGTGGGGNARLPTFGAALGFNWHF